MHARVRLLAAAALVAAAAACGWAALDPLAPAAGSPSSAALATSVWSARRVPGMLVDPVNAAREQFADAGLQRAVQDDVGQYGAGCALITRGPRVLASVNADTPLIPASTQKLMTAAAALTVLGPDFRYATNAVATDTGPTVGQLWLVGAGDPVIRTAEYMDQGVSTPLEALADAIVGRGVRSVGTVVGDDHRYDDQRFVPSWSPLYREEFDVGPLGALTVTEGIPLVGGKPVMVGDPALFAAQELTRLLRARGVAVGEPTRGIAPADAAVVGSVQSQPLRTIVGWMLATSDNVTAEMLTKELGVHTAQSGTTAAGVAAVQHALTGLGVDLTGEQMVDGSGLDRGNRTTCRILASVVALGDRPELRVLRDTLPGGGRVAADGALRAKGGYLTDVTALAGVAARTPPLRFAFIANGGVPKAANVDLTRFAGIVTAYQSPSVVPDDAVPAPIAAPVVTRSRRAA